MRIRDELGEVYADARFAAAFGVRGRPGISPGRLMMASVLQFSENLTDRQAAEAVRDRMTWKYALGLELEDPGSDASVLSEFRSRLVAGDLTCLALDALLERLAGLGLVKAGGRQRTDSTHVLGAIRALNRLELAGETVRAALEALAVAAPGWLTRVIDESWQQVYGARVDDLHLPESQGARKDLMVRYGADGYYLLEQVHGPGAPGWVRRTVDRGRADSVGAGFRRHAQSSGRERHGISGQSGASRRHIGAWLRAVGSSPSRLPKASHILRSLGSSRCATARSSASHGSAPRSRIPTPASGM